MKRFAYYIGITSLFFAIVILQFLFFDFNGSVIIIYFVAVILYDVVRLQLNSVRTHYKAFLNYDEYKLSEITNTYHEPKLLTQRNMHHLYLLIDILYEQYDEVRRQYNEFTYLTDLEQYYTGYIFEFYYVLSNDIDAFMNLHKSYNKTKNKVLEDNITTWKPGVFFSERSTFTIDLAVLDLIYGLYNNIHTDTYVDEFKFRHNVYNFIKEKALFNYYINTEQKDKARRYWEQTDFLYDHIKEEDFN